MLLEGLKNRLQQHDFDCLVTCCKQILDSLGIERSEKWLWDQLASTSGQVTVFTNIVNLSNSLGLVVEYHKDGTIEQFASYIESGLPIIVAVTSDDSQIWPFYKEHAVVVIGFDDDYVYVNDPAQPETGLMVEIDTFQWAWVARDYQFAVIRLA